MAWLNDHPPAGRHRHRDPGSEIPVPKPVPLIEDDPSEAR